MDTLTAIKHRFSANHFSSQPVADETLTALIDAARQAPSSFNQQHTRFLAVQDLAARQTLRAIAYNQAKVEEAPLVLIVLGDLLAHEHFAEVAQADVEAGIFNQDLANYFVNAVKTGYADPARAHDEAIRSGSLAAMNLMTAATALGLVTGPMIGFDAAKLKQTFAISDRYLPVLMITVGYNGDGNWPKKTRRPIEELIVRDARPSTPHAFSA